MSSISSNSRTPQRVSSIFENFKSFPAYLNHSDNTRLKLPFRWRGIATALSPEWLAICSTTEIILFPLKDVDRTRDMKSVKSAQCVKGKDEIRGIAMSRDLIAVVTHKRLILYAHREPRELEKSIIEDKRIDQSANWTPKSVAIRQRGSVGVGNEVSAWIVVGGEGTLGVKLFKYRYSGGWSLRDCTNLGCPQNTTAIGLVSFQSEPLDPREPINIIGVTIFNRIYCWTLNQDQTEKGVVEPSWRSRISPKRNEALRQPEITSAVAFLAPSRTPYMLCAINQRRGSQCARSWVAALGNDAAQQNSLAVDWCELGNDEEVESNTLRHVLSGGMSSNGQFIAVVEEGCMRLLTLHGAYYGGIGVSNRLEWRCKLRAATPDSPGVSILVREEYGALEIIAVDCRGHVNFARVNVKDMPGPSEPRIFTRPSVMLDSIPVGQLPAGELAANFDATAAWAQEEDRIDVIPG